MPRSLGGLGGLGGPWRFGRIGTATADEEGQIRDQRQADRQIRRLARERVAPTISRRACVSALTAPSTRSRSHCHPRSTPGHYDASRGEARRYHTVTLVDVMSRSKICEKSLSFPSLARQNDSSTSVSTHPRVSCFTDPQVPVRHCVREP